MMKRRNGLKPHCQFVMVSHVTKLIVVKMKTGKPISGIPRNWGEGGGVHLSLACVVAGGRRGCNGRKR
jgi:hypothetical protein